MDKITWVGGMLYAYCTDFLINISNLLGVSYYEVNFIIFCVVFPLLTLFLLLRCSFLYIKLQLLKKSNDAKYF
jgi:hypothetical protein